MLRWRRRRSAFERAHPPKEAIVSQYVTSALDYLHSAPPWAVYGIVFLWMLIEGIGIGVPIEPVLLFVGAFAVRSDAIETALMFGLGAGIALLGTLVGASIGYAIGRGAGRHLPQVGKYIGLTQERIDHMELWLRRRGFMGVFIARIVPLLRGFSPYVIGASRLAVPVFIAGTLAGAIIYETIWTGLGVYLGDNYQAAFGYLDQFGYQGAAILVLVILLYFVLHYLWAHITFGRLVSHWRRHSQTPATQPSSAASSSVASGMTADTRP
jgi:membrane protein DedA with SNARE-associated domain